MKSGSYEFDTFENHSDELGRLSEQASHFIELERRLLTEMGVPRAQRILEIGCGPGFVTRLLSTIAPESQIIAIDRSLDLLRRVPQGIPENAEQSVFPVQSSGEKLPVSDDWAQFIYARFLMQHVPLPGSIASEALRALSPGGIFCVADSDDGLVMQYPENPTISELLREANQSQREAGGDRNIGRKLPKIMHSVGFDDIQTRVISVTSSDVSIAALLGMSLGYKAELTGRRETLAPLIAELSESAAKGEYFFSTGVVITTGTKATECI